ncbi:hypothetical protein ACFPM0_12265 [Pseudonocardia sulfidoxydans]
MDDLRSAGDGAGADRPGHGGRGAHDPAGPAQGSRRLSSGVVRPRGTEGRARWRRPVHDVGVRDVLTGSL